VTITEGYPITWNDPAVTERMAHTLRRTAGALNVQVVNAVVLGAEDFSSKKSQASSSGSVRDQRKDRRGSSLEPLAAVLCR
jgi:metal-dependent amidase/aminoacylase/carboxypeptidase family protein